MATVVCIPTRRPAPVETLLHYPPLRHKILLICDPSVFEEHSHSYRESHQVTVVKGEVGMGAQSAECYRQAAYHGYKIFFRMDDDLLPKTFVHKDGHFPDIEEVIREATNCMKETETTLVGFVNSSNPYFLGHGYKQTYGIIWGGANLSVATEDAENFIDPGLLRCEDIYRTCAHRQDDLDNGGDGRVGRVQHIGVNKSKSSGKGGGNVSTIQLTREQILAQRQIILERFPEFISRLDDEMVRFRP